MDQISILFATMLASVSQMTSQTSAPPPTVAVQAVKKQSPPPPVASKPEPTCPDYGKSDADGNLKYFCH